MNTNTPPEKDTDDLEWLREIRRKITGSFDHDQKRIGDYLREREKNHGRPHRPRPGPVGACERLMFSSR